MRTAIKRIAHVFFAVLWLTVGVMGLELHARWHQRRIEEFNPFVLAAKKDGAIWQHADLDGDNRPVIETHENRFAANTSETVVTDDDHLGTQMASLNEADRELFATLREMVIALYDTDGANLAVYGGPDISGRLGIRKEDITGRPFEASPLGREVKDGLELIRRVAQSGAPDGTAFTVALPQGPTSFEMNAYPVKDASGTVHAVACAISNVTGLSLTEVMARQKKAANDRMWKSPFFEYRKNARLNDNWHTNNAGFRDHDVELPKPRGRFRILCIGGSTTEEGLTNETTYPKFLEQALHEAFPEQDIEVINCGVVGLDSLGERRRTLDYVQLQPDLVVEYGAVNDICHGYFPKWNAEMKGWRAWLARSVFLASWANALLLPERDVLEADMEQITFHNLRIMVRVFRERGISVAFCSFACPDAGLLNRSEHDYMQWNLRSAWQGGCFTFSTYCRLLKIYNAKLKALCEEQGLIYLPFAERFHGGIAIFGDITHMRPKGMKLKAQAIAELLAPHLRERLQ